MTGHYEHIYFGVEGENFMANRTATALCGFVTEEEVDGELIGRCEACNEAIRKMAAEGRLP